MQTIESIEQYERFKAASWQEPLFFFKHSRSCPISANALQEYERFLLGTQRMNDAYLDLLAYRSISNLVAQETGIQHESPQALLFSSGKVIWHASHGAIHEASLSTALLP